MLLYFDWIPPAASRNSSGFVCLILKAVSSFVRQEKWLEFLWRPQKIKSQQKWETLGLHITLLCLVPPKLGGCKSQVFAPGNCTHAEEQSMF